VWYVLLGCGWSFHVVIGGINPQAMLASRQICGEAIVGGVFANVCLINSKHIYWRPAGMLMPDQRGADEGSKTFVPRGGSRLDEVDMLGVSVTTAEDSEMVLTRVFPQNLSMIGSWTAVSRPFERLRLGSVVLSRRV